jgi:hypothetical protein
MAIVGSCISAFDPKFNLMDIVKKKDENQFKCKSVPHPDIVSMKFFNTEKEVYDYLNKK